MMIFVLMTIATALMVIGHIFKVNRWKLLIAIYERPTFGNLLGALSVGHVINAILPIRIGDIFRSFLSGRKLKNGHAFSIATVLVDLYVDVITVGTMFFVLSIIGKGGEELQIIAHGYMIAFVIIIPTTMLCILGRKYIKKVIAWIAHIFNENIEFGLLYTSYLIIASLKDIVGKINKIKFFLYTVAMWLGYVFSYIIFAEVIQKSGFNYTTSDVFGSLFSWGNVYMVEKGAQLLWSVFLIIPLLICLLVSLVIQKKDSKATKNKFVLPQMNQADRLSFLRVYYSEENREHINAYLEINNDVIVVEDNSAGSNASTVVAMKNEKLYFRKYAFGDDGVKLAEQIAWIEDHQSDISLPSIVDKRCEDAFVTYDMHSYASAVGLFKYIHTMPTILGWKILEQSLDDIREGLHSKNCRPCDQETIRKYIDSKVLKNLKIIEENDKYIATLEKNAVITVNGKKVKTLGFYKKMFEPKHMANVFAGDSYADIHGDLTIENIVCLANNDELDTAEFERKVLPNNYYFIDPNTGNVHDSPFLDYAKLLQSLHGNYEFLMMVTSVAVGKDSVNFMMTKSEAYGVVYQEYKKYLEKHFTKSEVLSIYYHEIIHWLRLMPYKIRKNEKIAVVFYVGLLQVLADVWEMENEK